MNVPAGTTPDVTPVADQSAGGIPSEFTTYAELNGYPVTVGKYYTFNETASPFTLQIAVDANRDGQIAFDSTDATSPSNPWHFWMNDSQEHGDDESSEGAANDQIPGTNTPNKFSNVIRGRSDLVNYFPVALNFGTTLQQFSPTNGYQYILSQSDGAINIVYTSLSPSNAFDYLTNWAAYTGYGSSFSTGPDTADVVPVGTRGITLSTNFLSLVQSNGGTGVILVEGFTNTTQPITLEMWRNNVELAGVPAYISISGVEQMWRHANFCYITDSNQIAPRADAPNEPPSNGKNLVFLHGYNVNQQQARGVESEMFKRFFWSRSKAHFYGVTWNGAVTQSPTFGFTPNYHTNVVNALLTAGPFANFINNLSGETSIAAHSLGNMVVLSAISDSNAAPAHYFMIDAAVPMEAVQGSTPLAVDMAYSTWSNYDVRLYASSWWQLFPTNDARSTLTWSNRLGNLGNVDIYNFYSLGEEVLREDPDDPPSSILGTVGQEVINAVGFWGGAGLPFGTYAWSWQEKGKGADSSDDFIGSSHGGWAFNLFYYTNSSGGPPLDGTHLDPADALSLTIVQLQTNAFFDFSSTYSSQLYQQIYLTNSVDLALYGSGGSAYAQANRDRILSDAIPAMTLAVGANHVDKFAPDDDADQNIDMGATFETGWPLARSSINDPEKFKWHHSDFDYVAYPFTHKLFDEIVNDGNLK